MGKELINMINTAEINAEKYYLMHPFSSSSNITYSSALTDIDFFSEFYVISNKTYERLAEIAALSNNRTKNTVIITGYRGCGKTNFLKYCQAIVEGKTKVQDYSTAKEIMRNFYKDCGITSFEKFDKNYEDTVEEIKCKYLSGMINDSDLESQIAPCINNHLKGNCEYINFGEDKSEDKKPLEIKLMRFIEEAIEDNIKNGLLKKLYDIFKDTERDIKNAFENASGELLTKNFFTFLGTELEGTNPIYMCSTYEMIEDQLDKNLAKMDIDQLLFITVLIKMLIQNTTIIKMFFLFDNIDIISANSSENLLFYKTIMKFWDFLREMRSYIDRLRRKNKRKNLIKMYDNCNFIFAMRETTAMHICDDLRERVKGFSDHFDISSDVDVSMIIDKKSNYLNKLIDEKSIYNSDFIKSVNSMQRLSKDAFFLKNLYPLFNNDYRTAIRCLLTICMENKSDIIEAIDLIDSKNDYMKYGGRGILNRLIFQKFEKGGYLETLGIYVKSGSHVYKKNDISYIRVCLSVLLNLQKSYTDRFFVNQEESVALENLFKFYCAISDSNAQQVEEFVDIINAMYALRNKSYWNHLITFDNILFFEEEELIKVIKYNKKQKMPVLIRATMAGEKYLQTVCVHFEFFACRFCFFKDALFSSKCLEYNQKKRKYRFEIIIKEVYEAVKLCCNNLKKYNDKILNFYGVELYSEIIDKPFIYDGMFHEERIIHNHISYIESYRWYLINNIFIKDHEIVAVNKKIISRIEDYLELLIYKKDEERKYFYSDLSEDLYDKFLNKIKKIKEKDYNDSGIKIIID